MLCIPRLFTFKRYSRSDSKQNARYRCLQNLDYDNYTTEIARQELESFISSPVVDAYPDEQKIEFARLAELLDLSYQQFVTDNNTQALPC
ncbi:hypothetical protein K7432_008532 [Basidiobolus ranarum]|uniref:Cytoplasmic protein n=1 Tax=Basidiobolus ranarum TaxID=34480 RepID=A0ABR2WRS8_9FUNG